MAVTAFTPTLGATVAIAATVASGNIDLTAIGRKQPQILVTNDGTTTAFIRYGVGAQTATAADLPVLGGMQVVISVGGDGANNVAAIMAGGTANIYFTPGQGD